MSELNPITHEEQQLAAILEGKEPLKPILHEDLFYAALAKGEVPTAKPITRKEMYLKAIAEKGLGGGGTPINNQDKTITENGTYTADEGYTGLGTVTVDVAATGGDDDVAASIIDGTCEELVIPKTATKIREYCFYNHAGLKTVIVPENIKTIERYAFRCSTLETVTLLTKELDNAWSTATNVFHENLKTLNVGWNEGAYSGAPWGAKNATINYNYTGE